jgi:FtsH-binding integral membrane protein
MKRTLQAGIARVQWLLSIIAALAFIAGYALSVIAGIWWEDNEGVITALVIMGLIVGLLNVTGREIMPYLIAAIALLVVGNFGAFSALDEVRDGLGTDLNDIVRLMAIFTAPAAVIQAIRAGIVLAKPDEREPQERQH